VRVDLDQHIPAGQSCNAAAETSANAIKRESAAACGPEQKAGIPMLFTMVFELNRWFTLAISAGLLIAAALIILFLRNQEP